MAKVDGNEPPAGPRPPRATQEGILGDDKVPEAWSESQVGWTKRSATPLGFSHTPYNPRSREEQRTEVDTGRAWMPAGLALRLKNAMESDALQGCRLPTARAHSRVLPGLGHLANHRR